jgi:hypothetical protein
MAMFLTVWLGAVHVGAAVGAFADWRGSQSPPTAPASVTDLIEEAVSSDVSKEETAKAEAEKPL